MSLCVLVATLLLTACALLSACAPTGSQHLKKAEEQSRQGNIDKAIAEYRLHISEREKTKPRAEWENPLFYLILIGDLELRRDNVEAALKLYLEADEGEVDAPLISDRLRSIAKWYEDKGRLAESYAVLQKYRTRDPLLFDPTLDRLAKRITELEDQKIAAP